ncbi:formyltransferase family protein [Agrobacterium rubi]|uniref:formyltransferase family protein n=1 Tax=Agrobacterium rubi TaxID=28099 RepID=UPI001F2AEF49|nr:formyltransferase family protein [Agrobacterium rubi]
MISNRNSAAALAYAKSNNIPSHHIPTANREAESDRELHDTLASYGADIVVLSGYLKKLGPLTLSAFNWKNLECSPRTSAEIWWTWDVWTASSPSGFGQ